MNSQDAESLDRTVRLAYAALQAHEDRYRGIPVAMDTAPAKERHRLYHLWTLARWDAGHLWTRSVWTRRQIEIELEGVDLEAVGGDRD